MGKKKLSGKNKLNLPRRKLTPNFKIKKPLKKKPSSYKKINVTKKTPTVSRNKMKKSPKKKLSNINKKKNIEFKANEKKKKKKKNTFSVVKKGGGNENENENGDDTCYEFKNKGRGMFKKNKCRTCGDTQEAHDERKREKLKKMQHNQRDAERKKLFAYDLQMEKNLDWENEFPSVDNAGEPDSGEFEQVSTLLTNSAKDGDGNGDVYGDGDGNVYGDGDGNVYGDGEENENLETKSIHSVDGEEKEQKKEKKEKVNKKQKKKDRLVKEVQLKIKRTKEGINRKEKEIIIFYKENPSMTKKNKAKNMGAVQKEINSRKKVLKTLITQFLKLVTKKTNNETDMKYYNTEIKSYEHFEDLELEDKHELTKRERLVSKPQINATFNAIFEMPKEEGKEIKVLHSKKNKQILLHFNMFKCIVIQNHLNLYNLENVNIKEKSDSGIFYFYNNKIIKNIIKDKTTYNYFFYLHPNLFEDKLINLILFVSNNGKILDKFVYGIEIQEESNFRKPISGETLNETNSLDCSYYILSFDGFPTFILNKSDNEFKKITSVFNQNNTSLNDYEKYDYKKVLQFMSISTNKIKDVSDTNYSLLTNPTNEYSTQYSTQYDSSKNLIENFEKYRVLNLNKLDDVVEHIKHYKKEKIIKMLIETYKYYESENIQDNQDNETLILDLLKRIVNKSTPSNSYKELYELFFGALLKLQI
jgi:hypothetical protein